MQRLEYSGRLRYRVFWDGTKYRIEDTATWTLFKSNFHTQQQADDWVESKVAHFVLQLCFPDSDYGSRARAHLLTSFDYYGDNERVIHGNENVLRQMHERS